MLAGQYIEGGIWDGMDLNKILELINSWVDQIPLEEGAITENYLRNERIGLANYVVRLNPKSDGIEIRGHVKINGKDVLIIDFGASGELGRILIQLRTTMDTVDDQLSFLRLPGTNSEEFAVQIYHSVKGLDPDKASVVIEEFNNLLERQNLTQPELYEKINDLNREDPDWSFFRNHILFGVINDG